MPLSRVSYRLQDESLKRESENRLFVFSYFLSPKASSTCVNNL
jgi:hypothetical protein